MTRCVILHGHILAMFSRIRSAAEDETYQTTVKNLRQKYYPIEMDPHIPIKDKIKHMEDWWNLSEKAIRFAQLKQLQFKYTR